MKISNLQEVSGVLNLMLMKSESLGEVVQKYGMGEPNAAMYSYVKKEIANIISALPDYEPTEFDGYE